MTNDIQFKKMNRIVVLANENAGCASFSCGANSEKPAQSWLDLQKSIRAAFLGYNIEFFCSRSVVLANQFLSSLESKEISAVILMGGDGTLNGCLGTILRKNLSLYVFPIGTANDFARELLIPADWLFARQLIEKEQLIEFSVLEVNGHPFLTVGGLGLGSEVVQCYNSLRKNLKVLNWVSRKIKNEVYSLIAIFKLITRRRKSLQVMSPILCSKHQFFSALFVCNQNSLGGNLRVLKSIKTANNNFGISFVPEFSFFKSLKVLLKMRSKEGSNLTGEKIYSSNECITVITSKAVPFFADGEIIAVDSEFRIKRSHFILKVYSGAFFTTQKATENQKSVTQLNSNFATFSESVAP